jgi:hypothetical protein
MGKIRYVVVSDIHSGCDMSLATALKVSRGQTEGQAFTEDDFKGSIHDHETGLDVKNPDKGQSPVSPVSLCFGDALSSLLERHNRKYFGTERAPKQAPVLVLLGDALDLAFASRRHAADTYLFWLAALDPKGAHQPDRLFQPHMIFVPGNHDHSLWTGARLSAEAKQAGSSGYTGLLPCTPSIDPAGAQGDAPPGLQTSVQSPLLSRLNRLVGYDGGVWIRYPNLTLRPTPAEGVTADPDHAMVLHHGHFCELTYRAMSAFHDELRGVSRMDSITVQDLSVENANWINFGWSTFGESRRLSTDVATLYEDLLSTTEAHFMRDRIALMLADAIQRHAPMSGDANFRRMMRYAIGAAVDVVFGNIGDSERSSQLEVLTPSGVNSLRWYIEGPVLRQLKQDLSGTVPDKLSFIFGHTHKPFDDSLVPEGDMANVFVCNIGGWYLDSARLDSREGARVLFIDDDLNAVTVSLFHTPANSKPKDPHVQLVSRPDEAGDAFAREIQGFVDDCVEADPDKGGDINLWSRLSYVASAEYERRQQMILDRIDDIEEEAEAWVI